MKLAFSLGLLFTLMMTSAPADDRWWDVIPESKSPFGGGFSGNDDQPTTPEEVKVLKQTTFDEWVQYEDEFVSFEYPKHPLIKFSLKKPGQAIKVEGGVCSMVDNSFTQAYQLKVGEISYALILLNPAKWLDDGICMCGPMVHHAYKLDNGTVTRFSMLPGGAVKKAQVIGGGLRFMAFEWTHLACPRPIYERIVNSMRIKTKEPGGNEALEKELLAHYEGDAKIGLISKGAPAQQLIEVFGEPQNKTHQGVWSWQWIGTNYPMILEAQVIDGKFVSLPNSGIDRDHDNPVRGSISWCAHQLELLSDLDEDDPPSKPMPQQDRDLIAKTLSKTLEKHADTKGYYWQVCVNLAGEARHHQIYQKQWTELILKHGIGTWYELEYLSDLKPEPLKDWLIARLNSQLTSDQAISPHADVQGMVSLLIEINRQAYLTLAPRLWSSNKPKLMATVFEGIRSGVEGISDQQLEAWILSGLQLNPETMGLVIYNAMDTLPQIKVTDPTKLLEAINKLPEGRELSEWQDARTTALKSLQPQP